jgi:hypothetical protein
MIKKLDLKKDLKYLYQPAAKVVSLVDVPCFQFLMIDAQIELDQGPGTSPAFQAAVEALYGAAYTLKFTSKLRKQDPIDYAVMPLEGLWSVRDGRFDINIKDNWDFTLMIMQPEHITQAMLEQAQDELRRKKGDRPAFAQLRLESFEEGRCVQIMHVGPYSTEPATVARLEAFAAEHGLSMRHRHHEIYLGNPLRAAPQKLKTVLRHAVQSN